MAHEFLSDEWMDAVEALRDEMPSVDGADDLVINLVITDCPFGEREAHISGGQIDRGLVDGAPTTLTVPYDVARKVFVEQDPQAAMQAFMGGHIKVQGDMTKLMATMQAQSTAQPTPEQEAFANKLKDLTA